MKKFLKWLDLYLEEAILVVLLIAITVVMTLQIIMRVVFNYSLSWPEEFNRICFIISTFFTLGYAIRRKKMLKVDIVVTSAPKRLGQVLDLVGKMVALAFYVYVFYGSIGVTYTSFVQQAKTPAIGFPLFIAYGTITIGFALAVIRSIQELYEDAKIFNQQKKDVI